MLGAAAATAPSDPSWPGLIALAGASASSGPPELACSAGPEQAPEVWPSTARTHDGVLHVGGVSVPALAATCGTPLYVLDESDFRARARRWQRDSGAGKVHYAAKAFLCGEMVKWVDRAGLHLDVCSFGELELALRVGLDPARIALHGNNKSPAELACAVERGVGVIVLDCLDEVERLAALTAASGRRQDVYLRVTPGVAARTHEHIATGGDDVKFGFPITGGHAEQAAVRVSRIGGLRLIGVHTHIGSQLLDPTELIEAARRVGTFVRMLDERHGIAVGEIDLGGGAGIAYVPGQTPLQPAEFGAALRRGLADVLDPDAFGIAVEPGRSLIGPAGITVYRVGVVKDGLRRRFVSVDGGMSDALRPSLYGARYTAWVANRELGGRPRRSVVCGTHCESGDVVVPDIALPDDLTVSDLLAVPATGAYHHALASNYNLQRRPAVVSVADGVAKLMVRRETFADLRAREAGGVPVDLGPADEAVTGGE